MAVQCSNCTNPAQYSQADPGANTVHYCVECLPHWLHERANAGHFPLVTPVEEKPATSKKSSAKSETPAEEPAAPAEETPADAGI